MPKKGKKLKNIHHQNTHPSPSYHYEKKIQNSSLKKITTKLAQQSQPQLHKNNLILEGTLSQYGKILRYSIVEYETYLLLNIVIENTNQKWVIHVPITQNLEELFHFWKLHPERSNKIRVANWILSCTNIEFASDIIIGARYDHFSFQEMCRQEILTYSSNPKYRDEQKSDITSHLDTTIATELFDDLITPAPSNEDISEIYDEEEGDSISSLSETSKSLKPKLKKKLKKKKAKSKLKPVAILENNFESQDRITKSALMNELQTVKGTVDNALASFTSELSFLKENIQQQHAPPNEKEIYFSVSESNQQSSSNYDNEIAELKAQMRDMLLQLKNVQKEFLNQTNNEIKLLKDLRPLPDQNQQISVAPMISQQGVMNKNPQLNPLETQVQQISVAPITSQQGVMNKNPPSHPLETQVQQISVPPITSQQGVMNKNPPSHPLETQVQQNSVPPITSQQGVMNKNPPLHPLETQVQQNSVPPMISQQGVMNKYPQLNPLEKAVPDQTSVRNKNLQLNSLEKEVSVSSNQSQSPNTKKSFMQSHSVEISQEMLLDRVKNFTPKPSLEQENETVRAIVVKDRWQILKQGLLRLVRELKAEKDKSERFQLITMLSLIPKSSNLSLLHDSITLLLKYRHVGLAILTFTRIVDLFNDNSHDEIVNLFPDFQIFQTIFESFQGFPDVHTLCFDLIKFLLLKSPSPSKYDDLGGVVCSHFITFSTSDFGSDFSVSDRHDYIFKLLDLWCILTDTSSKNRYRLGNKSACQAISILITQFGSDALIVKKIVKFLFLVTKESTAILNRLGECGICELMIDGLRMNMKTIALVELYARGVLILCTNRHRVNQSKFGTIQHLNTILSCLDWSSLLTSSESPAPSVFTKLCFMLEGVVNGNEDVLQVISGMPHFFKTFQTIIRNFSTYPVEIVSTTCKFLASIYQYKTINAQILEFCPLLKESLETKNSPSESRNSLRKIYKKLSTLPKNELVKSQSQVSQYEAISSRNLSPRTEVDISSESGDHVSSQTSSIKSPTPPQTQRKSNGHGVSSHRKLIEQPVSDEQPNSPSVPHPASIPSDESKSREDSERKMKDLNSHADAALLIQKVYRNFKNFQQSKSKRIRMITLLHVIPTSNDSEIILEAVKTSIESENKKLGLLALQRINEVIQIAKESKSTSPIIILLVRKPVFLIELLLTSKDDDTYLPLGIEILTRLSYASGASESLGSAGIFNFLFTTLTRVMNNEKLCSTTLAFAIRLVMKCPPNRLRGGTKPFFSLLSQILAYYSKIPSSIILLDRLMKYICHCLENSPENQINCRESGAFDIIQQIMSDPPRIVLILNTMQMAESSIRKQMTSFLEMMCRMIINLCGLNNHSNLLILANEENLKNYLNLYLYLLKQGVSYEELKSISILLSSLYSTTSHLVEIQDILQRIHVVTYFNQYLTELLNSKSMNSEENDNIVYTTLVLIQFFGSIPYLQQHFLDTDLSPAINHYREKKYHKRIRKCAKSILQRIYNNSDQSVKDDDECGESVEAES